MATSEQQQRFTKWACAITCLIAFQGYLAALLTPALARTLHASKLTLGFSIPAFAIPFGVSSFLSATIACSIDRRRYLRWLIFLMALLLVIIAGARDAFLFLIVRICLGALSGGIMQIIMSVINDLFTPPDRTKLFIRIILAFAAGMTFGPSLGIWLYPVIGWQWTFGLTGFWAMLILYYALKYDGIIHSGHVGFISRQRFLKRMRIVFTNFYNRRIYTFIFLNGVFHSGLFVWTSYYFSVGYRLGYQGTGLVLLIFSLPGLLLAASIGTATRRYGVKAMVFSGISVISLTIVIFVWHAGIWLTLTAVPFLSIGYVMTQPFYSGVIEYIKRNRNREFALGLGFGCLFLGYGTGPVFFQLLFLKSAVPGVLVLILIEILLMRIAVTSSFTKHVSILDIGVGPYNIENHDIP